MTDKFSIRLTAHYAKTLLTQTTLNLYAYRKQSRNFYPTPYTHRPIYAYLPIWLTQK